MLSVAEGRAGHLCFSAANHSSNARQGTQDGRLATASHGDAVFVLSADFTLWCTSVHAWRSVCRYVPIGRLKRPPSNEPICEAAP
jgi:hypothetical protein